MRLVVLAVFFTAATAAFAQSTDTLRMKLGLWHAKQSVGGLAAVLAEYHACAADRDSNYVVQEEDGCTKPTLKREGSSFVVESVCEAQGGGKAFQRVVITGSFDSTYTEQKTTTFRPPREGIATARETVEWRWIASKCKGGMKPGDVEMIRK